MKTLIKNGLLVDPADRIKAKLAGHTWFREHVGAADKYAPVTEEQLERMEQEMAEALLGGTLGISFGIRYVPGTGQRELEAIAGLCRKDDRIIAAHIRDDAAMVCPPAGPAVCG